MTTTILKFHDAQTERPETSLEDVLLLMGRGNDSYYMLTSYSKRHDAFNAHDYTDTEHAFRNEDVKAWAILPDTKLINFMEDNNEEVD